LKQQKFVIEAEPSELVRISILTFPTSLFRLATLGHATPYSKNILLTVEGTDLRCEGKDCKREGMGGCPTKADLFRFVLPLRVTPLAALLTNI
jgi:hypothetical protein